jgi:hypothetical protein
MFGDAERKKVVALSLPVAGPRKDAVDAVVRTGTTLALLMLKSVSRRMFFLTMACLAARSESS